MTENKRFTLDSEENGLCKCILMNGEEIPTCEVVELLNELDSENKELQERNNRQCKQLDDLYRLIEEKDWRALSDIMDDFKKSDELLQKEWGLFG